MARRGRPPKLKGPDGKGPAYEVGYGKPPVATRFRPGQSGNQKGRPKGARNRTDRIHALNKERMKTVVLEEAYRLIGVRDGDRLIEIPVIQAIIRVIAVNAAKGHFRSQQMFGELVQWVERENRALHESRLRTAIEYKCGWEQELEYRERAGATGPEPLPHPDDIVINLQTDEVELHGPMTKEDKVIWDRAREFMKERGEVIEEPQKMIATQPKNKRLSKTLARQRKLKTKLTETYGAYAARLDKEESKREAAGGKDRL